MIRYILFCILAQSAKTTNITNEEVKEAYKYFESIHDKLVTVTQSVTLKRAVPPTPPTPSSLLAVLHNLQDLSSVTDIKPLEVKQTLLEPREQNHEVSNNDYTVLNNAHSNIYKVDRFPAVEPAPIEEIDRRKFLDVLDNFFRRHPYTTSQKPTTTQEVEKEADKRRMFEWFTNLFGKATTSTTTEASSTTGASPIRTNDNFSSIDNITEVLVKLNNAFERLNQNIRDEHFGANKSDAFLVLKLPIKPQNNTSDNVRRKREIKAPESVANNHTRIHNKSGNWPKTSKVNQTANHSDLPENSFKFKILAHLVDSFNEIKYKIAPLAKIKEAHSSKNLYKIGYIVASIDTLEENLNKFMQELNKNKNKWEEKKILDFFDKLKTSNHVLRTLMDYLERLTEQDQVYQASDLEK